MDDNVKELIKYAILCHDKLTDEFGQNDWADGELNRVVELNGGKLKCSNTDEGFFELIEE